MAADRLIISGDTVLADAIRQDPAITDRLMAFHAAFAILADPAVRHQQARIIRFDDAARVAGVPVEHLIAVARGEATGPAEPPPCRCAAPDGSDDAALPDPPVVVDGDWFAGAESRPDTQHLDVRSLLAAGTDPFATVMARTTEVPPGTFLVLDAPFDPAPLRRVLARKGFPSQGRQIGPGHWRICCRRNDAGAGADAPDPFLPPPRRPRATWREADGLHLDVRGLEPPEPMVLILRIVESGEVDSLIVHHDREPMFLYPELAERHWDCRRVPGIEGEVRLKLYRQLS